MFNPSNQHSSGPHQEQTFDNISALCLALGAKNQIWDSSFSFVGGEETGVGGGGGGAAPNRLFMKGVGLSPLFFSFLSDLLCLRSSRSEYL